MNETTIPEDSQEDPERTELAPTQREDVDSLGPERMPRGGLLDHESIRAGLAEGSWFGPFRILRELGRGGMGVVYRAEQEEPRREVALKVMRLPVIDRSMLADRFEREIQAAGSLQHDHIVRVFLAGQIGDHRYYAMELVRGENLGRAIPKRGMECLRAARIARQVALALAHAHSKGIVHRDLKPANILLREEPGGDHALVVDFGLALLSDASRISISGLAIGTPVYMSPEQAKGDLGAIDHRTDIYSLGATLYEMLTGCTVYRAESFESLLADLATRDPLPPRALRPEVPRDLDAISRKMLAKNPGERYQTAEEAASDLGRFLEGRSVLARPPGPLRLAFRRHRRFVLASLALATILALPIAWASRAIFRETPQDDGETPRDERPAAGEPAPGAGEPETTAASLAIDFEPPSARVALSGPDGLTRDGVSPCVFENLAPGSYRLQVSLGSPYVDIERTLEIEPGSPGEERGVLEVAKGRLEVVVHPPGSTVLLRRERTPENSFEKELELTAPVDALVPIGSYHLTIHGPDDPGGRSYIPQEIYGWVGTGKPDRVELYLSERRRVIWQHEAGFEIRDLTPVLADLNADGTLDPVVVGGGHPGRLLALDGRSGEILWSFSTEGDIFSRPALADLDRDGVPDAVFVCRDRDVAAVSGRTRESLWTYQTGHFNYSTPALADLDRDGGTDVLVSSYDGDLHALRGADGSLLWKHTTGGGIERSPVVADLDGDGVSDAIVASADHALHAASGRTGERLWNFDAGEEITSGPAIADLNGDGTADAVAGTKGRRVLVLSGKNGDVLRSWNAAAPPDSPPLLADLDSDGTPDVVIGSGDEIHATSGRTGESIWTYDASSPVVPLPSAGELDGDGVPDLVAVTLSGWVHALSGRTGRALWTLESTNQFVSSPPLADLDGDALLDALVPMNRNYFRAVHGASGRELWRVETGGYGFHSSAAVADLDGDGTLDAVLLDIEGTVWAVSGRAN
ncbi:MAG: PQQ-binding-like beta-propeller repeat protein [Planctomycetes bacterium]|nr:PQQ-binding-like beta-propeller repeat protein [Planctomycetota bacterium]